MKTKSRVFNEITGLTLCLWVALTSTLFFHASAIAPFLPFALVLLVPWIASRFGRVGAALGVIGAGVLYAVALFPPLGNFAIESNTYRSALMSTVVVGELIIFLMQEGKQSS